MLVGLSKNQKGQTLLEVILAISLLALSFSAVGYLVMDASASYRQGLERTQAVLLAREGLEAARSICLADFDDLTAGVYGITLSGAPVSASWTQTTVADFSAGSLYQTKITNNSGGEVTLANTGAWSMYSSSWSQWTETTDTDFGAGTLNNAAINGTGESAEILLTQSSAWTSAYSPVSNNLNDVYMLSATDGWAVGASGKILHYIDGGGWTQSIDTGNQTWRSVHMLSSTDGWAVGASGKIERYYGDNNWTEFRDTGNQTWNSIYMLSASDGWIAGSGGEIRHWDGSIWSDPYIPSSQTWYGIQMVSSTDGWVVGTGGEIRRWDGSDWDQLYDTGGQTWYSINMVSATDGWVSGNNGEIYHWNGSNWTIYSDTGNQTWYAINMASSTDGWVAGSGGEIYHYNGSIWTAFADTGSQTWASLFMVSTTDGWLVGRGGAIYRYGGGYSSPGTYTSKAFDSGFTSADWGTATWTEVLPSGTDLTIATRTGNTATPDGSWSSWSSELSNPAGSTITSPDAKYIQYRATLTSTGANTPQFQDITITYRPSLPTGHLNDVHMLSASDGWAVGNGGAIIHWNGTVWSAVASPVSDNLNGLYMVSASDGWAVGAGGKILHYDGTSWSQSTDTGNQTWNAVYMVSASSGWLVGSGGAIWRYTAPNWSTFSSPTGEILYDIQMLSATDGWIAGAYGTMLHYVSSSWNIVSLPDQEDYRVIDMLSATEGWAAGSWGAMLRWNGSVWSSVSSSMSVDIYGLDMLSATEGWAAGEIGQIIYYDGSAWSQFASPYDGDIYDIQMLSATDGWGVGWGGQIIRFTSAASYYTTGTFTSSSRDTGSTNPTYQTISWTAAVPSGTELKFQTRTADTEANLASAVWVGPDGTNSTYYTSSGQTVATAPGASGTRFIQYKTYFSGNGSGTPETRDVTISYETGETGDNVWTFSGTSDLTENYFKREITITDLEGGEGGDDPIPVNWQQTTVADFQAGTRYQTKITDTDGGEVTLSGTGAWNLYANSWSQWIETTDTDFGYGSLNNAQISGTDAGAEITLISSNQWSSVISPVSNNLNDIYMLSATEGWAAGDSGKILRYSSGSWNEFQDTGSQSWKSIQMVSSTDGWAVGNSGKIERYNSGSWSQFTDTGSNTWYSVFMLSASDGWLVGASGKIYRWNGTSWSQLIDTGNETWKAVYATSSNDVWIIGSAGELRHWNGFLWNIVTDTGNETWNSIYMISSTDGWIVNSAGGVWHWDGTNWSPFIDTDTGGHVLNTVFMTSASDGWIAGGAGEIFYWNGTRWSLSTDTGNQVWASLFMLSATDGWLAGSGGAIYRYGGGYSSPGTYTSRAFDSGFTLTDWGTATWTEVLPSGTDLTIATRTGNTATPDGSWSSWSSELSNPAGSSIASSDAKYIQYRATLTSTGANTPQFQDITINYKPSLPTGHLNDVFMLSSTDGWAVGNGGAIIHWNGTVWSAVSSPVSDNLNGLYMVSASDGWAVGAGGKILHYDGTSWSQSTDTGNQTWNAVYMVSASSGWVVGSGGAIWRYTAPNWSTFSSPTGEILYDVKMLSATDGWIAASYGTLLRWTGGSTWSVVSAPNQRDYRTLDMLSSTDGWAAGELGAMLRWNNSTWSDVSSSMSVDIYGLDMLSATEGWAAGEIGQIIYYDGSAWSGFTSPYDGDIYDIQMLSATDGWGVGWGGQIVRFTSAASYYTTGTFTSSSRDTGSTNPTYQTISWTAAVPSGTELKFQTRTADTEANLASAVWVGPDGTNSTYYTSSGQTVATAPGASGTRWIQYQAYFAGDGANTPEFRDITIGYEVPADISQYTCDEVCGIECPITGRWSKITKGIESKVTWQFTPAKEDLVVYNEIVSNWSETGGPVEADNLTVSDAVATLTTSDTKLEGLIVRNDGGVPITIDKLRPCWTNAHQIFQLRIGNEMSWTFNSIGSPSGDQYTCVELDVVDIPLAAGEQATTAWMQFREKMTEAIFYLDFIMSDASRRGFSIDPDITPPTGDQGRYMTTDVSGIDIGQSIPTVVSGIDIGNSGASNITIDRAIVSWNGAESETKVSGISIGGISVWSGNNNSGDILDVSNQLLLAGASGIPVTVTFSKNITGIVFNILFIMTDGSKDWTPVRGLP